MTAGISQLLHYHLTHSKPKDNNKKKLLMETAKLEEKTLKFS